jgi:carboxyl-terminal processing protease
VKKVPAEKAHFSSAGFPSSWSLALLIILLFAFAFGLSASPASLTPKDRLEVFEKIWKEIDEHYYDPEFGGVNWQEVHQRYLPLVQAVKEDESFYVLMDRMTAELHDAHTRFSSPEQWQNRKKHQGVSLGFHAGFVENKVVVLDVLSGSNAAKAGVEPGMIVTALDGKPIQEQLAEAEPAVLRSSSERVTKLRVLSAIFSAPVDSAVDISLQRADGSVLEAKFARQLLSNAPEVIAEKLPDGFGYIQFDEFQHGLIHDFKNALENFRNAPGVILDLRRNRGGDGATLAAMAQLFFDEKTLFERRMSRRQVSASERDGRHTEETQVFVGKRSDQVYAGPVVILISEYSASATEVFSAGMQDAGRALLVGSQSCGCVLGITHDRVMKGGGVLEISEVLWFSPRGRKLEGQGVIPDRMASPTIASLQQKQDLVLEEGEKVLRELAARAPATQAH